MSSFVTTPQAVLFLDVDGVLTTERCLLEEYDEDDESLYFVHKLCPDVTSFIPPLEKSRIAILKGLIDQIPHMKIVISSTWRINQNMCTFLYNALECGGINVSQVVLGGTPCIQGTTTSSCRGSEIVEWLNTHPEYMDNFAIVDDEHVESFVRCGLVDRLVQTSMHGTEHEQGLNEEAAEKILRILCHSYEVIPSAGAIQKPRLVFLCGIPGIGKDTLCDSVCKGFPNEFQHYRCYSQDEFLNGLACRQAVEIALSCGYSVILKRNNHTQQDRRAYVEIAQRLDIPTAAIVPHELKYNKSITLLQICCRSAIDRVSPGGEGHESLRDVDIIPWVCSSFFKAFEAPSDEEISVVRSISYLTNDQVGECHIYLDDDHTIGLNRYQLTEYESFSPFSTDEMTGEKNALSFCIPAGNFILGQRRRTQEAIANDFVQILKDISFI